MYKILRATSDAYITNRVINRERQTNANLGSAGSLDLFKLYGITSTVSGTTRLPNTELSRLLVKFDLRPLQQLVSAGKVDPTNGSFRCRLQLRDVYGGQPTPSNFSVNVHPLATQFIEGLGHDVVFYSDYGVCNWLSASYTTPWLIEGCGQAGDDSTPCDYLTASVGTLISASQNFTSGEEDLDVDVTAAVSAMLASQIPDAGFRIAFSDSLETDNHTYFVKRFGGRTAYNEEKHPQLVVMFDDSIQDDSKNMHLDAAGTLFLRNYVRNAASNLISGSIEVTGNDCLILQLSTVVSGGTYSLYFTGSQHFVGTNPQPGLYSASVLISATDPILNQEWQRSGSISFTPVWQSLDGTITYLTDDVLKVYPPQRGDVDIDTKRFEITVRGVRERVLPDEQLTLRVHIFDLTSPYVIQAVHIPVEMPGVVVRDVHYQVRDSVDGYVVVPFDTVNNSTRLSNDSTGMYFKLDTSNLIIGHTYVIDILVVTGENKQVYENASPAFRVGATT